MLGVLRLGRFLPQPARSVYVVSFLAKAIKVTSRPDPAFVLRGLGGGSDGCSFRPIVPVLLRPSCPRRLVLRCRVLIRVSCRTSVGTGVPVLCRALSASLCGVSHFTSSSDLEGFLSSCLNLELRPASMVPARGGDVPCPYGCPVGHGQGRCSSLLSPLLHSAVAVRSISATPMASKLAGAYRHSACPSRATFGLLVAIVTTYLRYGLGYF